jgi:NADH-quinone oxidoreductase subunit C
MTDEPKSPPNGGTSDKPVQRAAPAGPVTSPQKPAATSPPKPTPKPIVKPEPWASPLLEALQERFPGAISDALIFRGQAFFTVQKERLIQVAEFLKSEGGGSYCLLTDETVVDYPKREKRFEIIYQLYSFERNDRLRMKVLAGEAETVPSVTAVWPAANWLEREIYDMFGVVFEGHPELKRILLPEDWTGHPLRKDYDILRQDPEWVRANLKIESGQ